MLSGAGCETVTEGAQLLRLSMPTTSRHSLLAVLAASAPGGAILVVGLPSAAVVNELLAAMDITTRLLVVADDPEGITSLRQNCQADLRISLHAQPLTSFLDDIAAHQFSMIVFANGAESFVDRACGYLVQGGVAAGIVETMPSADAERVLSTLRDVDVYWVAARRARAAPVRRGGRKRNARNG